MGQIGSFQNAVVIGAGGGIGTALVDALVLRGTGVVHALSRSGRSAAPAAAVPGVIDIGDEVSIAAAAACVRAMGAPDLVLVATGLLHGRRIQPEKTYRSLDADTLAAYFAVNAIGPALVAKHFLPLLPRDQRAVFACLSARVGSIGDNRLGGWYGYRASKAALNMLIRTSAIELARTTPHAICVGLHPGTVRTGLSAPFQGNVAPEKLFSPAHAAECLLDVVGTLTVEQSGSCFAWDGERIPP